MFLHLKTSKLKRFYKENLTNLLLPLFICFIFFIAYSTLSLYRHDRFDSGFDLAINDQVVWKYSQFKIPITTIDHVPFISNLKVHVELFYALISPLYWIFTDVKTLLLLQNIFVCFSALPVYLLFRKYHLHKYICYVALISYLLFYGVQNALWYDAHSNTFAASLLSWFIYFLITDKKKWTYITFLLAITAKENIALLTLLISLVLLLKYKTKKYLPFLFISLIYLFFIFGIYFPYIVEGGYRFQSKTGLFSAFNPADFIKSSEKKQVIFYSLVSVGFLPLLYPLSLFPVLGNLASYFILGKEVTTAQGLYLHYRIELAPLLWFSLLLTFIKYPKLNKSIIALYLFLCIVFVQYFLHLPVSYLSKQWFWSRPENTKDIEEIIKIIPQNASVVSQNNITPHLSHRDYIFTLWPEKTSFSGKSPCAGKFCDWFRWAGRPEYLVVDISKNWDIRHLLANNEDFQKAVSNMEIKGKIKLVKAINNAKLYKINY